MLSKWVCFFLFSMLWAITFLPITKLGSNKLQSQAELEKEVKRYNGVYGFLTLICLAGAIWAFTKLPIFPSIEKTGWRIVVGLLMETLFCGLLKIVDELRFGKKPKKS